MTDKLPRKYLEGGFDDKVELSKKHFQDGALIEAFTVLYAVIEQRLKQVWQNYIRNLNNKKWYDEFDLRFEWELPQIIRNLREIGELTEEEYQQFTTFKSGRDKAVHVLPFPLEDNKTNMNILKQSFQSGLEADAISHKLQIKYPFISKEDMGKNDEIEKRMKWITREQKRVEEILKRKENL